MKALASCTLLVLLLAVPANAAPACKRQAGEPNARTVCPPARKTPPPSRRSILTDSEREKLDRIYLRSLLEDKSRRRD